jgi:hypothetical protein
MPSLELVTKILKLYPDISPDWLILGEGDLFRTPSTTPEPIATALPTSEDNQFDLFAPPVIPTYSPTSNKTPQIPDNKPDDNPEIVSQPTEDSDLPDKEDNAEMFTVVKNENGGLTPPSPSVSQSYNVITEGAVSHSGDSQGNKIVKKIIFFYGDNTFETFLPAEN